MKNLKYYNHDYTAVSDVDSFLTQLLMEMRQGQYDMKTAIKLLEVAEGRLRAYLAADNLVEEEDGSLLLRDDMDMTLDQALQSLKIIADKCGGKAELDMSTIDGFRVKISARKLTEEELHCQNDDEEEEEEDDD